MTQYLTGMWASSPAISAQPVFGWFNVTLPVGYVTGTGFTVVFVGGAQFDTVEPSSWQVNIEAWAAQAASGTFPTPATTGFGAINSGPFDGNIPETSFAPGTTLLVYADDTAYLALTTTAGMSQTFSTIVVPGANHSVPSIETTMGGVVLANATIDPIEFAGLPAGTGVIVDGATAGGSPSYSGEGPVGYDEPGYGAGNSGPSSENGHPLSPIPQATHSYAAGDTVSVLVRLTAASFESGKALRALIKSINVHVGATTINVPITSLYVGFGTHATSGTTTMRLVNSSYISPGFPSGGAHHTDLFLVDIAPPPGPRPGGVTVALIPMRVGVPE